jgi:exodeoxyribonuclease VII large subunit
MFSKTPGLSCVNSFFDGKYIIMKNDSLFLDSFRDKTLTVSELVSMIKDTLEESFFVLQIEGEKNGFVAHKSGHFYFTLKDEHSQIDAVMFKNRNIYVKFRPENGMKIIARGKITVYEERGRMQLLVEFMEQVGLGEMLAALHKLVEKLNAEGLFDPERKKPIPKLPQRIGLVTSRDGAALRDFLNIVKRRFENVHILIYHSAVQGEGAPAELIAGIEYFDNVEKVDVIVLTRGGGSVEDLMPFNDEQLARTISACSTPLISAVGHEVDYTIADYVADMRAPTPSAAAELIIEKKAVLHDTLENLFSHLRRIAVNRIMLERERLIGFRRSPLFTDPFFMINRESQRLDYLEGRLSSNAENYVRYNREKLSRIVSLIASLNPESVLERGYSITIKADTGDIIGSGAELKVGDKIETHFTQGSASSNVTAVKASGPLRKRKKPF